MNERKFTLPNLGPIVFDTNLVVSVRLITLGRHPKTSGFDVAEGRI
jgi:hypothetical protein